MIHHGRRENSALSIDQDVDFLRDVIGELTSLQQDDDLLERYQCFTRLTKQAMERVFGPCSVSLWCQDDSGARLVECMITSNIAPVGASSHREPCRLPLDNPVHRLILETGKPYLAFASKANISSSVNPLEGTLKCLAALVLERPYGRPVLVNVDRIHDAERNINPRSFYLAVDLIRLMWSQLQAVNQRQWDKDHDPISRALRDDVFLERTEQWARQAQKSDQLFAVAVLALHGFRGAFAGQAHQWRQLSGAVSRIITETLNQRGRIFLLGRMADDVFALYLPHADSFIAQTVTQHLTHMLATALPVEAQKQRWNLSGLELRWGRTDIQDYCGSMTDLLNRHYRLMFTRSANKPECIVYIDFQNTPRETIHAGANKS
ncbi:MAG: GGDEF domain-containing protein [Sedimentisphaerales bacterium]|nr:GGDEF domain-containing protein [Sedimentisphaerales bacterium]